MIADYVIDHLWQSTLVTAAIAALTPTRSLCLACHDAKVDHNPQRECTRCHFQADPEQYRARLRRKGGAG